MYCNSGYDEDGDDAVVGSFPTLINDVGKVVNVSAVVACFDNCVKGSLVTFFALHLPPFATLTFLLDERWTGIHASFLLSFLT